MTRFCQLSIRQCNQHINAFQCVFYILVSMAASHEETCIGKSSVRSVYLVMYSQADLQKFPSRNEFASAVVTSFESGSAKVKHWCCSRESHVDGGQHYHLALKLQRSQRWLHSKRYLEQNFGIAVNYSSIHYNYYSAWQYVTKEDTQYEESTGHPRLNNEPRTSKASVAKTQSGSKRGQPQQQGKRKCVKKQKKKRLTAI